MSDKWIVSNCQSKQKSYMSESKSTSKSKIFSVRYQISVAESRIFAPQNVVECKDELAGNGNTQVKYNYLSTWVNILSYMPSLLKNPSCQK